VDDVDVLQVQPDIELAGIEAHEAAYLEVRDPPLGHQPANMARRDAEYLGNPVGIQ
jgi:hypothetical protein